ncbi:MAG: hypothetical protein IKU13_04695 [Clostridia bacterium]|nr:hypothetical protein [Clostridia bacterium]
MKLPERKPNRLAEFDYSTDGAYFITVCVRDMRCILAKITVGDDALGVPIHTLTPAGKIVEKYILSSEKLTGGYIDKYVVMPNHIHMIVRIEKPEGGLPRASTPTKQLVPEVVGALKRLVNRELGGNIFQRSFHDHVIRGHGDYNKIWEYIDTNPLKWMDDCFYIEEQ